MDDLYSSDYEHRPGQELDLRPWFVVLSAALFLFYEFIQMNMLNALSTGIAETFQLSATSTGLLSSTYFAANVVFLLPAGILLDRFSTRKVILISLSICILGTFLFATAPHFKLAAFYRFLTGIGSAFCFLACMRLATRWFEPKKLALVTGIVVTMAMIGGMVAQAPLAYLAEAIGWRQTIMLDALLGIIILVAIFFCVKDFPQGYDPNEKQVHEFFDSWPGFWQSFKSSYLRKQNWLCGIYTSLMNLPIFLIGGLFGIPYLTQVHGFKSTGAAIITSMVFIGTILGSPLLGYISDRSGFRRLPMIIGVCLSLPIMLLIILIPHMNFISYALLFFLLGLTTSSQILSYPTVAESNPQALSAMSISIVSLCAIGGGVVFQPLFGWIMDLVGSPEQVNGIAVYSQNSYQAALFIMPVGFIIALMMTTMIRETHCRKFDDMDEYED